MSRFEGVIEAGKAARTAAERFTGIDDFMAFAQHVALGDKAAGQAIARSGDEFLNPHLQRLAMDDKLATYSLPETLQHLRGDNWADPPLSGNRITNPYPMRRVEALIKDGTLGAFGMQGKEGPELRFLTNGVFSQVMNDAERHANLFGGERGVRGRILARNGFMRSHGYFTTGDAIKGGLENFSRVV